MTTVVFEADSEEVGKIKKVLKALGVKNIWIQEDETKLTKEEFEAKLQKAKRGKGTKLNNKEEVKDFFNSL